jgi:dTDP-4-amino-4,6-dideoxygalactose transaminase
MQRMLDEGIATRRGVMCAHREPAYATAPWTCGPGHCACNCQAGGCDRLRESERAQERTILLPLFHQMTDEQQAAVSAALHRACAG